MLPGDVAGYHCIELGLHGRGSAPGLQPGEQRVLLRRGVLGWIVAGPALPDPEMSPLLRGAVAAGSASSRGVDAQESPPVASLLRRLARSRR